MASEFSIGLDIGTSSIKAVILSHHGKAPQLVSFGSVLSPQPGMMSTNDVDLEAVSTAIKNLLVSIHAPHNQIITALPESKIFTRIISDLPFLSDEEIASAIKYSAEEFVPLPSDQVDLYWQVVGRSKPQNRTQVFVVASPKKTTRAYLKVLEQAKLQPIALETELIAATRVLLGNNIFAPTTMLIQMGASSTDFAVISKGMILLTRSIATGGIALTRSIAQYLNFELNQAEEYKKTYGLLSDQLGGKIYQVLKPLIDLIVAESSRVIQAFHTKNPDNPIKRVVLSGGGAKMPGLVVYFAGQLNLEIQEADPWGFVQKDPAVAAKLAGEGAKYTVATGLALREQ